MSSQAPLSDRSRRRAYAAVWAGARQLGLTRDDVHEMAAAWTGRAACTSLTELTDEELHRILDKMREAGFRRKPGETAVRTGTDGEPVDGAQVALVQRLWVRLHRAGAVADPSARALARFAARQVGGVEGAPILLRSLSAREIWKLTAALESWLRRVEKASKEAGQ